MNQNLAALVFLLGCFSYVLAEEEDEEGEEKDWKNYWIAHGVCASLAWAIIVPLAIGSALLRKKFVGETWLQIHRLLNILAAILTIASFGIAVYIIREEDGKSPWKEYPHFIVGLTIFIATLLQVAIALARPRHHMEQEPTEKDQDFAMEHALNEDDRYERPAVEKSILRRIWEAKHRLFGLGLLATAWWQVQDGWKLFEEELGGKDAGSGFMGAAAGISVTIVFFYVIQLADPRL
jgi:hypothetical protein